MSIISNIKSEIQLPLAAIEVLVAKYVPTIVTKSIPEAASLLVVEAAKIGVTVSLTDATNLVTVLFKLISERL